MKTPAPAQPDLPLDLPKQRTRQPWIAVHGGRLRGPVTMHDVDRIITPRGEGARDAYEPRGEDFDT